MLMCFFAHTVFAKNILKHQLAVFPPNRSTAPFATPVQVLADTTVWCASVHGTHGTHMALVALRTLCCFGTRVRIYVMAASQYPNFKVGVCRSTDGKIIVKK